MNWRIPHHIIRSTGIIVFILFVMAGGAQAQYVVSAKAGVIQFAAGDVFLEDKLMRLSKEDYAQMENGQSLRTKGGFAEMLLGPDVYLRLGMNGQLKMYRNRLNDIQLALDQGSALIENVDAVDLLHQWAALRSFTLFADNPSTRTQGHWTYIDLGWLKNYNYRMSFHSPEIYAERTRNRNTRLSAEAILVTAAKKAEQAQREAAAQALQEEWKAKIEQAMRASQPSQRIQ
jgi:hypothetical protein